MSDWKEKLRGYCPCFSGDDNKLGLIINYDICDCSANDLKFVLYSKRQRISTNTALALIKLNLYTYRELKQALRDIFNKYQIRMAIWRAKQKLKKAEYHVYCGKKDKILKCYDKNKL